MTLSVLGLDIGGANLKAAHTEGTALSRPFLLWQNPDRLAGALQNIVHVMPGFDLLAVTMTGELCDCYETKRQGVAAILDAVEAVAQGKRLLIWQAPSVTQSDRQGRFVDTVAARRTPWQTGAANWLALATFCGRWAADGPALHIDIGSTTTDIVPLMDGRPVPRALHDPDRLRYGELVYTGVRRTPLCALLGPVVAAELFATTLDVYLVLGYIAEDECNNTTADGRPATKAAAYGRLARMICSDGETSSRSDILALAAQAAQRQAEIIAEAMTRAASVLPDQSRQIILSGEGEFLWHSALQERWPSPPKYVVSLKEQLGPDVSAAACAYATAKLAQEFVAIP